MARGAKLGHGNGRRRVWRCPTVFPDGTCPTVGGASMARGVDGADQEKTGSKSIDCPGIRQRARPCAKLFHGNGHDLRRLISRLIMKMNLRPTFTFACMKKPDIRRALRTPLHGRGVEKGSYAYNRLFFSSSHTFTILTDLLGMRRTKRLTISTARNRN